MNNKNKKHLLKIGICFLLLLPLTYLLWINSAPTNDTSPLKINLSSYRIEANSDISAINCSVTKKQNLDLNPLIKTSETVSANSRAVNDYMERNLLKGSNLETKNAYAIVVGISNYPGSSSDLQYCDDDAQDVRSLLINEYNFEPHNILYLQDSAATKNEISNAFDQISSQITENDIFFFFYSGHGGFGTEMGPFSTNVESPHNYPNNYDNTWSISHPGAAYMRVHFYRLATEEGYDAILCGDSSVSSGYCYELYSGNYGYNFWSAYIPVDRYYIRLFSDYSITAYGFKIDYYEVIMDDGTHYMCSYDSLPSSPNNYYIDDLLDSKLDMLDCQEKYAIVDACHSGGLIPEVQDTGRYIMSACEEDESSLESSSLQHGVFSNFFLDSHTQASDANGDGVLSMEECYEYTRSNTISYSSGMGYTHHPMESDNIAGESVLKTSFSGISLVENGNTLEYSFTLGGIGHINELKAAVYNVSGEEYYYNITDLTTRSTTNTGFESYSGTIQLEGLTGLSGYGLFAEIDGYETVTINATTSGDYDNDGLDDLLEIIIGSNPGSEDTDFDGLNDFLEYSINTNPNSSDTDNDQIPDLYEVNCNLNPCEDDSNADLDLDGLTNLLEYNLGTLADDSDTDDDGMPDGYEYQYNFNLLQDDAFSDADFDGLPNILEYYFMTIPIIPDSDNDGLVDGDEVTVFSTNPLSPDTDLDGTLDGVEASINTNPLDPRDSYNKIILNYIGIATLLAMGITGSIMAVKYVKNNKKHEIKPKDEINRFKIKLQPNSYNSMIKQRVNKPQPEIPSYYSPYKPPLLPSQGYYPQSTSETNSMKRFIKDILLKRVPPPEPSYTEKGRRATVVAQLAMNQVNIGRYQEAGTNMVKALVLGVPEPYNSQFRTFLLKSLELAQEQTNYMASDVQTQKSSSLSCPNCGFENETGSKFCIRCGKVVAQQLENVCNNCGSSNEAESKFCIKCGKAMSQGILICKNCGNMNEKGSKFCEKCGGML